MNNGAILIHRKLIDWEWYSDNNTKVLFLHCLLKANWEEKKWRGITIQRGQFFTSIGHLAAEVNLSSMQVRNCIEKLKTTNEITTETTSEGTKITVCNYDTYQDIKKQNNKRSNKQSTDETTSEQQASNKPTTTTNSLNTLQSLKEYIHPLEKLIDTKFPNVGKLKTQPTLQEFELLESTFGARQVEDIFGQMENYKKLIGNYTSVYLTANNWLKKETAKNGQTPYTQKVEYKDFKPL